MCGPHKHNCDNGRPCKTPDGRYVCIRCGKDVTKQVMAVRLWQVKNQKEVLKENNY